MIELSKTSLKPIAEKRDMSDGKGILTSTCRSSLNKRKVDTQNSRKTLAGSLPEDIALRNYDQQLKMKLMDLTPRNRAKETSEGVQEFIKHVSDIIEQKNPFKETAVCSWPRGIKKNANSPVIDSIQFNGVSKRSAGKVEDSEINTNCEIDVEEINKKIMRKLKYRGKINSVPVLRKDAPSAKAKINRPKSSFKKREQRDKKLRKDATALPLRVESRQIKSLATGKESQDVASPRKPALTQEKITAAPLKNQRGRGRPSEIPLRKDRKDLVRKPKPLTLEPLKETERKASWGLQSNRPLSPLVNDQECPELQMTINVDLSSEKICIIGEEIKQSNHCVRMETIDCVKTEKRSRSSSVSKQPSSSSKELQEEISATGRKSVNLDKVKTSSFTVLRNNSVVRNRLESLHKKNVLSKDKSAKDSSKITLNAKSSFKALKGKTSKKNLHFRLNSKGNKSGLKLKTKNAKQEAIPETRTLRKRSKSPQLDRDIKTNGKVSGSRNKENPSNERFKSHNAKRDERESRKVQSARERSTPRKAAIPRNKEEAETTLAKQKEIETVVTGLDCESQTLERPNSFRNSLLGKIISEQSAIFNNSTEKKIERALYLDSVSEVPMTPPPTPNNPKDYDFRQNGEVEEDQWSSETVNFDEKFNSESYLWRVVESDIPSQIASNGKEPISQETAKHVSLVVKGTPLNIGKDEPPEGVDSPAAKKRLNIDLRTHGASSKVIENEIADELNEENAKDGYTFAQTRSSSKETAEFKEGKSQDNTNGYSDLLSMEMCESGPLNMILQKSCSSLKWKSQSKSSGSVKGARKKKIRSEAEDRQSTSDSVVFNSEISVQSKNKPDAKVRSGLTKSSKREEKSDVFDDLSALKLRRRNSEPYSFRGYVWKCVDSATPKDHKASVSSLTSSLRHLNTDDIDDFIFWEAVPQKMTSCWEMSLYHFKRPWSVLSCSVFRDNRESSTPGLILENLRNGGTLSGRRFAVNQNERAVCRKENPFDVEPSIAQKNIDIRNWVAALNFPTLPSTSNDGFNEGSFSTQTAVDAQNFNKSQANPKRRKVLSISKFSEETSVKKSEETKYRKSSKWCNEEGLTDLVRRKSGGFVTCEQYLNSQESTHRPNLTVNFCVYSKSAEESILVETSDRSAVCEPRKYKSVEITGQPELSISATIINSGALVGDQLIEKTKTKEKPQQETPMKEGDSGNNGVGSNLDKINIPERHATFVRPNINIWKYLFLITVFIIIIHYCYLNSHMCHNYCHN